MKKKNKNTAIVCNPKNESDNTTPFEKMLTINHSIKEYDFNGMLNTVLQYINIKQQIKNIKKGTEYIVQIPSHFLTGFESGKYSMMQNAETGVMRPALIEKTPSGKKQIATLLPIEARNYLQNNPIKNLADNYNNLYIQAQFNQLTSLIENTLDTVKRIERGQKTDRIGQMTAGRDQLILALKSNDEYELKLARQSIMNARGQFFQAFKEKVESFTPVPKAPFFQFLQALSKIKDYYTQKDNEYNEISDYYALYIYSTNLISTSYIIEGKPDLIPTIYDMSINEMKSVNFKNLKTLSYTRKKMNISPIYDYATDFLKTEKSENIKLAQKYDCLAIEVSGEKLLEALNNV